MCFYAAALYLSVKAGFVASTIEAAAVKLYSPSFYCEKMCKRRVNVKAYLLV